MFGNVGNGAQGVRNWFWNHRIIVRIISALVLFFGIAVMFANTEGRVENIANILVETKEVLPENEGKLVIVSGTPSIENDGVIVDEEANLQVKNAYFYRRIPLQLAYVKKPKEIVIDKGKDLNSTLDDKTEKIDYVETEWIPASAERENKLSDKYGEYENPPKVDLSSFYKNNYLCIGNFKIDSTDVHVEILKHVETKEHGFTKEVLKKNCQDYIKTLGNDFKVVSQGYKDYAMISNGDEIGDIHVKFSYGTLESMKPITVIGRQKGDKIVSEDKDDLSISEQVYDKILSKDEYIKGLSSEDADSRSIGFNSILIGVIGLLLTLKFKRFGTR